MIIRRHCVDPVTVMRGRGSYDLIFCSILVLALIKSILSKVHNSLVARQVVGVRTHTDHCLAHNVAESSNAADHEPELRLVVDRVTATAGFGFELTSFSQVFEMFALVMIGII